jgi:transcriptional regulator with XRE-family HTH domain
MELRIELARDLHRARDDAGSSLRQVARAAGVSTRTLRQLEAVERDPGVEVMARVSAALGGRLRLWYEPGTGVAVHDRYQAPAIGALVKLARAAWRPTLEVGVTDPVRGVIDAVLEHRQDPIVLAVESESDLRRIEQQVRWAAAKAGALATARASAGDGRHVSRLLLLRSTRSTRAVAATYADVLRAAYPASSAMAAEALRGREPWPGAAIVWCEAGPERARILDGPPRGVLVGR